MYTAIEDVLLFQNILLQKLSSPSSIPEGGQSVYTARLDGPPPSGLTLDLAASDGFLR